jgi:hypothetical protein
MGKRPILSKTTKASDFKNYYWDKQELITFCRQNKIPAEGGKIELAERIAFFLSSGGKIKQTRKKTHRSSYDSDQKITVNTPVVYYKNDAKTRDFFVSQIGNTFKFNFYLRAFAKQENNGGLTYGDLVQGYKESLKNKKTTIDKQFEYNQFQRDFHKNNLKKTRLECNQAWKLTKQAPGGSTYKDYLKLTLQKKHLP